MVYLRRQAKRALFSQTIPDEWDSDAKKYYFYFLL